jgi:hypothetical protein
VGPKYFLYKNNVQMPQIYFFKKKKIHGLYYKLNWFYFNYMIKKKQQQQMDQIKKKS